MQCFWVLGLHQRLPGVSISFSVLMITLLLFTDFYEMHVFFFFFVFFLTWPNRTIILIGISLLFSLFFIFIFFARCILSSPLSFFTLCTHTHPFPYLSLMFIESCPPPPHTLSLSRIQRRLPPVWPDRRWEDLLQSVWGRDAGPRPEPSQCWGSQGSRQPQGWG